MIQDPTQSAKRSRLKRKDLEEPQNFHRKMIGLEVSALVALAWKYGRERIAAIPTIGDS